MLSSPITSLAPPPLHVPLSVACSTMLGLLGWMGALFLLMGMIFFVLFAGDVRPLDEIRLGSATTFADATITDVNSTNSSENDVTIYEYRFTFKLPNEDTVAARNYTAGYAYQEGDKVPVKYLPDKPTVAELQDARLSEFPAFLSILMLIFPGVGAILYLSSVITGWREVRLLRSGEITGAPTINAQPTNTRINNQPVMKFMYQFQSADGQIYNSSSKSLPKPQIGDEQQEPILYLPSNPKVSMLVDALPLRYSLDVDGTGQWASDGSPWSILWFGLSVAVFAGSLLFIFSRLI